MQIITPSELNKNQHFEAAWVQPAIRANLEKLIEDPQQNIGWTSDVNKYVPFKPSGTHIFTPDEILHTASWPSKAAAGYTAGLVTPDPVGPSSHVPGLIHELANIPVGMGGWQVIVTSCSLYEKIFAAKRAGIREITEEAEKLASQVLKIAESYFSADALPHLKFIFTAADAVFTFADTARKVSEVTRKADNTQPAITGAKLGKNDYL